jgi:hypothetical protein
MNKEHPQVNSFGFHEDNFKEFKLWFGEHRTDHASTTAISVQEYERKKGGKIVGIYSLQFTIY